MHKLGIHVLGHRELETRLYNWCNGFQGEAINLWLPQQGFVHLVLTGPDIYELKLEGDLCMGPDGHRDEDLPIQIFGIGWSDEGNMRGTAEGKVILVNSRAADSPSVFNVTLGKARLEVVQRQPQAEGPMTEADRRGIMQMMCDVVTRQSLRISV